MQTIKGALHLPRIQSSTTDQSTSTSNNISHGIWSKGSWLVSTTYWPRKWAQTYSQKLYPVCSTSISWRPSDFANVLIVLITQHAARGCVGDMYVHWQLSVGNGAALWAQSPSTCLHICNAGSSLFLVCCYTSISLVGIYISHLLEGPDKLSLLLHWVCKSCLLSDLVYSLTFVTIHYRTFYLGIIYCNKTNPIFELYAFFRSFCIPYCLSLCYHVTVRLMSGSANSHHALAHMTKSSFTWLSASSCDSQSHSLITFYLTRNILLSSPLLLSITFNLYPHPTTHSQLLLSLSP